MGSFPKKLASGILAIAVVSVSLIPFLSAQGDTNKAVDYVKSKTLSAWGAMAIAAAGQTADVSSFKSIDSDKAIDYEAPILALTAQNKDPRTYPNTDYVAKLESFWDGTQLGSTSTNNDDVFGLLALRSAGVSQTNSIVSGIKTFLLAQQNANGGFSFATGDVSDTNTTAAAIMALLEAGVAKTDTAITKAVTYLKGAQNADGGFPYDPVSPWGTASDASSDSWVIAAINKLGDNLSDWTKDGKTPVDHLLSLQNADAGWFAYQAGSAEDSFSAVTTSYAVIGLSNKSLPVKIYSAPVYPQVTYRIVGKDSDVCVGETNAPDPLQLVKIVAASCNTDYHINETSFGPYLDRIGTDTAAGVIGWLYSVNSTEASVGAADHVLKANDEVLWYYADYRDKLTRISLASAEVASGGSVTATVEYNDAGTWEALSGASVHAANTLLTTGSDGKATLTLPDGSYKIYATLAGYLRTEADALVVGTKVQNEFPLTATVPGSTGGGGGSPNGTGGVSFVLGTPTSDTSLGFGTLQVGQNQTKTLTITNQSASRIYIEALVTGSDLFRNYLTINNAAWRAFSDKIDANSAKNQTVGMSIPSSYNSPGQKTGTLTIWATPTN